jgi:hypothetical protein
MNEEFTITDLGHSCMPRKFKQAFKRAGCDPKNYTLEQVQTPGSGSGHFEIVCKKFEIVCKTKMRRLCDCDCASCVQYRKLYPWSPMHKGD